MLNRVEAEILLVRRLHLGTLKWLHSDQAAAITLRNGRAGHHGPFGNIAIVRAGRECVIVKCGHVGLTGAIDAAGRTIPLPARAGL